MFLHDCTKTRAFDVSELLAILLHKVCHGLEGALVEANSGVLLATPVDTVFLHFFTKKLESTQQKNDA